MNKVEPVAWRGLRTLEKIIIVTLPLLAAAVFLLPNIDQAFLRRLARVVRARPFVAWLVNDFNAWIVAGALLLLTALIALWIRHRMVSDRRLWYGTGCPNCMERELVRVSRHRRDRLYSLAAIPAYRYACRNCTWRGLRIARREYSPERELELEEALLRFQPDAGDLAAQEDADVTETPITLPGSGRAMFRDAGDVIHGNLADPAVDDPGVGTNGAVEEAAEEYTDIDSEVAAPEGEVPEGLEWLWRRSADS